MPHPFSKRGFRVLLPLDLSRRSDLRDQEVFWGILRLVRVPEFGVDGVLDELCRASLELHEESAHEGLSQFATAGALCSAPLPISKHYHKLLMIS